MISYCSACSAQNFVSDERAAVKDVPPRCWRCGEALPAEDETTPATEESNGMLRNSNMPGSGKDG